MAHTDVPEAAADAEVGAVPAVSLRGRPAEARHAVTLFPGKGVKGPVTEVCVVCRRGELKQVVDTIEEMWPGAFYVTELAGTVSGIERPIMQPLTGARGVFKKK